MIKSRNGNKFAHLYVRQTCAATKADIGKRPTICTYMMELHIIMIQYLTLKNDLWLKFNKYLYNWKWSVHRICHMLQEKFLCCTLDARFCPTTISVSHHWQLFFTVSFLAKDMSRKINKRQQWTICTKHKSCFFWWHVMHTMW